MYYFLTAVISLFAGALVSLLFQKAQDTALLAAKADIFAEITKLETKIKAGYTGAETDVRTFLAKLRSVLQ